MEKHMRRLIVAICATIALSSAAQAADPAQLKFGFPAPPQSFLKTKVFDAWVADANAAMAGAAEIKMFVGPVLGDFRNIYDRTIAGVADLSFGIFGPIGNQFPKTLVVSLPFETRDAIETSVVSWRLLASGLTAAEQSKVKSLALFSFPSASVHLDKAIAHVQGMKGLKLSVSTKLIGQVIENLGASPVAIPPTDTYQSLSRGVIQGIVTSWNAFQTFKLAEVTRHHIEAPLGASPAFLFMNKDSFARLPEAARKAIEARTGESLSRRLGVAVDQDEAANRNRVKALAGQTIAGIPAAEMGVWREAAQKAVDGWVADTEDGAKLLAALRAEVAKHRSR
jgi:TRAP-type C4-dicarboxylate transport system substrate-binding protein